LLLDLFLIGLVVNLEPIPLTAMILLLAAERGVLKGAGFVLGWMLTLVVIVAVTVLATDGRPPAPSSEPSTAVLALKLACGAVLLLFAFRRRNSLRRRARVEASSGAPAAPPPPPRKQPKWMAGIDRVNPLAAAGVAFLVQPWVLVAAGVANIADAKLSNPLEYLGVFAFCLWCTVSYLTMEIYAVVRPAEVQTKLRALLEWINQHRDQAIAILSLTLGLYLMAKSIYGIVSAG
jgi:threonine/homoserine/homoserine lactone efflux protein